MFEVFILRNVAHIIFFCFLKKDTFCYKVDTSNHVLLRKLDVYFLHERGGDPPSCEKGIKPLCM